MGVAGAAAAAAPEDAVKRLGVSRAGTPGSSQEW